MKTPILGGRNNRAYKVEEEGKVYFLKHYNKKSDLDRSRLETEYVFLEYAALCKCTHVTPPISCNEAESTALYEFIEGERYQPGTIGDYEIQEALAFIRTINQHRNLPAAQNLAPAAEACFSIAEHVERVDQRIQRLSEIVVLDDIDEAAVNFIEEELKPAWQQVKEVILVQVRNQGLNLNATLSRANQVISPSDFGFHNALKLKGNRVMFVDFEYAGWDDPAKLIGDFFNQIEVAVPLRYVDSFIGAIAELVADGPQMIQRAKLLLPLYRIKWCCIILNYFLPLGKVQKDFVAPVTPQNRLLQLQKAQNLLHSLGALHG